MIAGVVDPNDPIVAFRCSPNETYRKRRTTEFILTAEGSRLKNLLLREVDQGNQSTEDQHRIFLLLLVSKMISQMNHRNDRQGNENDDPLDFDDLELNLDDLDNLFPEDDEIDVMDIDQELDDMLDLDVDQELDLNNEEQDVTAGRQGITQISPQDIFQLLIFTSEMLDISLRAVDILLKDLIVFTAIKESEWTPPVANLPKKNRTINEWCEVAIREYTNFEKEWLVTLKEFFFHECNDIVDGKLRVSSRHVYGDEFVLLLSLAYFTTGNDYKELAHVFGGDCAAYSHAIRWFTNHIHDKYYNLISGTSMEIWIGQTHDFRQAFFESCFCNEDGECEVEGLTFDSFRPFSIIDCMGVSTCAPGTGPIHGTNDRRPNWYAIQMAFYTRYGKKWGLKLQCVTLPNGMFMHIFCTSLAQNDIGVLNISGIQIELRRLFIENDIRVGDGNFFPAIVGDDIYHPSDVLVKKGHEDTPYMRRLNGGREKVEHHFGLVTNIWDYLGIKRKTKLYKNGKHAQKRLLSIYFLTNCYTCFRGNTVSATFRMSPPTIEQYLGRDNIRPYADE